MNTYFLSNVFDRRLIASSLYALNYLEILWIKYRLIILIVSFNRKHIEILLRSFDISWGNIIPSTLQWKGLARKFNCCWSKYNFSLYHTFKSIFKLFILFILWISLISWLQNKINRIFIKNATVRQGCPCKFLFSFLFFLG